MMSAAFWQALASLNGRVIDAGISASTRTLMDLRAACEQMIDEIDREIGSRDAPNETT